jgi:hypothetical protein
MPSVRVSGPYLRGSMVLAALGSRSRPTRTDIRTASQGRPGADCRLRPVWQKRRRGALNPPLRFDRADEAAGFGPAGVSLRRRRARGVGAFIIRRSRSGLTSPPTVPARSDDPLGKTRRPTSIKCAGRTIVPSGESCRQGRAPRHGLRRRAVSDVRRRRPQAAIVAVEAPPRTGRRLERIGRLARELTTPDVSHPVIREVDSQRCRVERFRHKASGRGRRLFRMRNATRHTTVSRQPSPKSVTGRHPLPLTIAGWDECRVGRDGPLALKHRQLLRLRGEPGGHMSGG